MRTFIHRAKLEALVVARAVQPAVDCDTMSAMKAVVIRKPIADASGPEDELGS
jgi:hypothetical protein